MGDSRRGDIVKASGIVTLLTDFGEADGYVAAMKGVILSLAPDVRIVDVSHGIAPQDVLGGAWVLATAAPWFPDGTVHVAVVDPGVGSERRAVALRTSRAWYVGPDNGLLWRAAGLDVQEAVSIEAIPGWEGRRSATFHGRDLFAPAGAFLATGGELAELGPSISDLEPIPLPKPEPLPDGGWRGEVVHIDGFGNAITNISEEHLPKDRGRVWIEVGGLRIEGMVGCYAEADEGKPCALIGSEGLLEVSVNGGSAAQALGLSRGAAVGVGWDRP